MNKSWILIFGLLLLTIGCSEPADVATVDKAKSVQAIEPVNVEPEPAKIVKATVDETEILSGSGWFSFRFRFN